MNFDVPVVPASSSRSASIAALARACGATMTGPGAGGSGSGSGGSGEGGQGGSQGGSGSGSGSQGSDGGSGGSGGQNSGQGGSQSGSGGSQGSGSGNGAGGGQGGDPQDVGSLPQWAQNLIHSTRSEAAGHRQERNTERQRADEVTEAVKRALGLSEAPTAEQLGDQLRTAQATARAAQVEAAVARTAGQHDADPAKLLDSRSFLATVGELDPTAADFTTKVGDAIKAGVQANPALKASPPEGEGGQNSGPRRPAPDRSQGNGGRGSQQSGAGSVQSGRELYRSRHPQRSTTGS